MSTQSLSTIARLLNSRAEVSFLPPVIYMTDEVRVPNPLSSIAKLAPGNGVIFRHYAAQQKRELALKINALCRERNLIFLVAGDYALARDLEADGLHLPEYLVDSPSLNVRNWRQRPNKLLTAAAHSLRSLKKCQDLNVDAALISPIFPTKSHVGQKAIGVLGLTKMSRTAHIPVYALGGISDKNASQLLKSPAIGIAGIGAITNT